MRMTGESERQAVTTVTQCRVPIFAPVKQMPKGAVKDVTLTTRWGSVTFKNMRLTQVHRNILDCIFAYHDRKKENPDGSVTFLISARELQKRLGISPDHHTWLVQKLDEIRETTLIFRSKVREWNVHTGLIRKHKYSNQAIENSNRKLIGSEAGKRGDSRNHLYGIVFESEYMQVFKDELNIHSERLTEDIISLDDAFLQAFVRFIISHRQANFKIDDAISAVGAGGKDRHMRDLKVRLKNNAEILQSKFGIEIKKEVVLYTQHLKIWFQKPKETKAALV